MDEPRLACTKQIQEQLTRAPHHPPAWVVWAIVRRLNWTTFGVKETLISQRCREYATLTVKVSVFRAVDGGFHAKRLLFAASGSTFCPFPPFCSNATSRKIFNWVQTKMVGMILISPASTCFAMYP